MNSNNNSAELFLKEYATYSAKLPADLAKTRKEALSLLEQHGLPSRRNEAWRYTDVSTICQQEWPVADAESNITREQITPLLFHPDAIVCVFVNGNYQPSLSTQNTSPLVIDDLATSSEKYPELLVQSQQYSTVPEYNFAALNTVFRHHGTVIVLPDNSRLTQPLHLLYLATGKSDKKPYICHPYALIASGKNNHLSLFETYHQWADQGDCGDEGNNEYFNNCVTEIRLQEGAQIEHYRIQKEESAQHIAHLFIEQDKDSRLHSWSVATGGKLARLTTHANLQQPGAEAEFYGLYTGKGKQHIDHYLHVNHRASRTVSKQHYRGILDDHGHGVFNGRVTIHPDAQQIVASQKNANLLLSKHASVDIKPELEIAADDVQCSHGATIGSIDPAMLFYLRSRGIDEDNARSLLTRAFVEDMLQKIRSPVVKEYLGNLL